MIRIKVCKLSDITNRMILIIITFLFCFFFYQFVQKLIEPHSIDFIQFAIKKNLCFHENKSLWEQLIYSNFPASFNLSQDDIEKEFDIVDNTEPKISDLTQNTQKNMNTNDIAQNNNLSNNNNLEYLNEKNLISNNNLKKELLKSAYLLECEQLSNGKYKIGDVTINDYTKKTLNFSELEKSLFTKVDNDCRVLIYHTHTSESYINSEDNKNYRTEDNTANVVRVGEALKTELNQYGIFVRQDTTGHDYPSYNGAYKSSLKSVENILKNENYDIIIDIHRDALASNSGYRPTAEINGETVAKLMFVVGTNAAGLKHDDWIENLKFAIAFQQRANELFPGLFRDLHLSTSRYNQHTSNKTLILEVGATGNTIEEACLAMKYFAKVLNAMRG